jgi:peptidyl-prolyl cis-trans isomerase SurA
MLNSYSKSGGRIPHRRFGMWGAPICLALVTVTIGFSRIGLGQSEAAVTAPVANSHELDSVIAVVNKQVILASDLDMEIRLIRFLPINDRSDSSPPKALERLTTRALIEQQILEEDPDGLEVDPKDLEDSLNELRQNLPACKQRDCSSAEGWSAYLATIGLTPMEVSDYWSHRMAVLQFIEDRFRVGIRISPEDIQKYYNETFAPLYAKQDEVPPLARVSERIQEILLEKQVSLLLDDWLKSLQDQGQVEILDPVLATKEVPAVPPFALTDPGSRAPDVTKPAMPASLGKGGGL